MLQALKLEDKHSHKEITPVYLGGNGSRLLNWLDPTGEYSRSSEINKLLSAMLSAGSGFDDTREETQLSSTPKDEVACGLVLNDTRLKGLGQEAKDLIICGETCILNGQEIAWNQRLGIEETIHSFSIPNLERLSHFLYEYHIALKRLNIESIAPLEGYIHSQRFEDNAKLWKGTERKLKKLCIKFKGDARNIRVESPFILGLKALVHYLGQQWINQ